MSFFRPAPDDALPTTSCSDAIVCLTVAYCDTLHRLPLLMLTPVQCSDAFIGSFGSLFSAVGYSCICLLSARSDAFVCLTVAYCYKLFAFLVYLL